jgi:predicted DsbA family dithiol-disulfide isomerase
MKPTIKIDIVSDVVCPWCYIGKRRIEKAMHELSSEFEFDVNYLPFQLNPQIPKEGIDQKEHLAKKFGSEEKYNQILAHVTRTAEEEGLHFDFDKQKISPNTSDCHRLIWLAKKEGKQLQVKEALMKAYFEEGIDLTKTEKLIAVAVGASMDAAQVKNFLESHEGLAEVSEMQQLNYDRGISGVPFYIINNKYGISGAQPAQVFGEALREIGRDVVKSE